LKRGQTPIGNTEISVRWSAVRCSWECRSSAAAEQTCKRCQE